MMKSYFAPASTGNLSVGFDLIGVALQPVSGEWLGDILHIKGHSEQTTLACSGRYQHQLPVADTDNLVIQAYRLFQNKVAELKPELNLPELELHLEKRLPVGSGLGSSACSVVVALYAFNDYFQHPLNKTQLLQLMAEVEGSVSGSLHYDNVIPSLHGGLQLIIPDSPDKIRALPWFRHWRLVVSYPGTGISTKAAREVMAKQLTLKDSVTFAGELARFINALYAGDEADALAALKDVVAEPARIALMPELPQLRKDLAVYNIAHVGISGAGPTLFAVCTNDQQAALCASYLAEHYSKNKDAMTHVCQVSELGARQIEALPGASLCV